MSAGDPNPNPNASLYSLPQSIQPVVDAIIEHHRIYTAMHIPDLFLRNYEGSNPEEKVVLQQDKWYPVLFITVEEIQPMKQGVNTYRGYELYAYTIDQRNKLCPISLYACEIAIMPSRIVNNEV